MQIAEVVALPPACCAICKSGNAEEPHPFIDTQSHYPQGQRVDRIYVCFNCVNDMANLHGFISPADAAKFQDKINALNASVNALEAENAALEDVKVALGILKPKKAAPKAKAEE